MRCGWMRLFFLGFSASTAGCQLFSASDAGFNIFGKGSLPFQDASVSPGNTQCVKSHAFLSGIIKIGTGEGHVQINSVPFFGLQIISDANKTIFHTATMDPNVVKNDEMKRARVHQLWLRGVFYGFRRTHRSLYP
jgi:hypothetical protein